MPRTMEAAITAAAHFEALDVEDKQFLQAIRPHGNGAQDDKQAKLAGNNQQEHGEATAGGSGWGFDGQKPP